MREMHFSTDEWQAFKRKTIEPEICVEMEVHLQFCESCQEFYLGLIEPSDLVLAQAAIPLNFTDALLNRMEKQSSAAIIVNFPTKKPKLNRKNVFAYYVTAAVLTLALMSGGVFDTMADHSMRFSQICMVQSQKIEAQVSRDWYSQLFKDGSQWMNKLPIERERNVKDAK